LEAVRWENYNETTNGMFVWTLRWLREPVTATSDHDAPTTSTPQAAACLELVVQVVMVGGSFAD
jgi:hypothetical protein